MWDTRFEEILREHLPFLPAGEPLTEDLVLRDYGLDSITLIDVLALLEREFGTTFAGDAMSMENFTTPQTLWDTLSRVISAAA